MLHLFEKSALWRLVVQADWMSKIILILLFFLSVVCGGIIAYNFFYFRFQRKRLMVLYNRIRRVDSFADLVSLSKELKYSTGGTFLRSALEELRTLLDDTFIPFEKIDAQVPVKNLSVSRDLEYFEVILMQLVERILMEEEKYIPVLGVSAVVSPLVGLLGTVWGLIHSFVSISQERMVDITVVAPGIAEALITTLAGLMVAIPAITFFHYFSNEVSRLERVLSQVSDKLLFIIKKTFVYSLNDSKDKGV